MIRIGLAQIENHFEYEANLRGILRAVELHARKGSELVLFPECATTGFNTGLKKIDWDGVQWALEEIRAAARKHQISLALPTPWKRDDGKFLNSVLIIDETGGIKQRFDKRGFQKGEERLFVPGDRQAREFEIKDARMGVLICIEASHEPWDYLDANQSYDCILWPGFYAVTPGVTWSDGSAPDDRKTRENCSSWRVPLLQATCASSPEADSWPDREFGGSVVLNFDGKEAASAHVGGEDHLQFDVDRGRVLAIRSILRDRLFR